MDSYKSVDSLGTIYYKNKLNLFHRTDGPAVEYTDGFKSWWINGKQHREDGPAVVFSDGYVEYWLKDRSYSKEEWETEVIKLKLNRIKDL